MKGKCMVKPISEEFSGCLVDPPDCMFAVMVGFSVHCSHPEHRRMAMDTLSTHRGDDLRQRYNALREGRRQLFLSQLGMPLEECLEKVLSGAMMIPQKEASSPPQGP